MAGIGSSGSAPAGLAGVGLVGAYSPCARRAVAFQRFMDRGSGDTFNIDLGAGKLRARRVVRQRSGRRHGQNRILPESHTDFVFAFGAERVGIALCLMLHGVVRLHRDPLAAARPTQQAPFSRFAASVSQSCSGSIAINMAVNLHLMPPRA